MPRATYLFPAAGALAIFEGEDRLTIMEPATGWASTLTGVLAQDARALIDNHAEVPRLSALASNHVGVATLLALANGPRLDDSSSTAIRLEGFGTLFLELVGQCNERCTHCYAGSGPEINQALPRETCEQVITDAAALGFSRVQFTGGDPLLCKFLPELVAHAKACGIPQREVYTNGLALSASLLDQLAESEPTFAFSFYSSDPEVHDGITNTPGSHRRTSEAIRRTVSKGLGLRAGVIAMESNATGVPKTVDYLRSLGVESVAVSPTFGVGRGTHFVSETPVAAGNTHGGNTHGGNTHGGNTATVPPKASSASPTKATSSPASSIAR